MTSTDPPPPSFQQPEIPYQTFRTYLARQFIAKKGFEVASIPEVRELAVPGYILLTRSDGNSFAVLCLIDRETYPDAAFDLDVDRVRQIGEACLPFAGRRGHAQLPVTIRIIEVGPSSADQQPRLKLLKRASLTSKVIPSGMIVDVTSGEVWSSDKSWFSRGAYQGFVEKLLAAPREADADLTQPAVA